MLFSHYLLLEGGIIQKRDLFPLLLPATSTKITYFRTDLFSYQLELFRQF